MISIILPTYNEVDNIIGLIEAIIKVFETGRPPAQFEIIVVDDDSPDGTSQKVKNYIKSGRLLKKNGLPVKNINIRLETRYSDHGLTKSIQHGINIAKGDIVVWMDCDFSHPPEVIPVLLEKIAAGYDLAIASRFAAGGTQKQINANESRAAVFLSTVMNRLMRLILQTSVADLTSGFIAIKRDIIHSIPLQGEYGEYFIDLIVQAGRKNCRIIEVPYSSPPRSAGTSKTAPNLAILLKRIRQYSTLILRLCISGR